MGGRRMGGRGHGRPGGMGGRAGWEAGRDGWPGAPPSRVASRERWLLTSGGRR